MDKLPKGIQGIELRRKKFGGPENSYLELHKLKTDALLASEGVLVRRAFVSKMERIVNRVERGNLAHVEKFAIIGADIRKLKLVNSPELGGSHALGDQIIVNAGTSLAKSLRLGVGDLVTRGTGDEFVGVIFIDANREDLDPNNLGKSITDRVDHIGQRVNDGLINIREKNEFLRGNKWGSLDMAAVILSREDLVSLSHKKREEGDFVTSLQELVMNEINEKKKAE